MWTTEEIDSGSNWDSNILGAIAQNLTQLTTWDQAAKELVQNADDAEATVMSFSITNTGIVVTNNEQFTHCSSPETHYLKCEFTNKSKNSTCDAHAIRTYSSQNKKNNSDATGKFGVGFVSTFLFTDKPEIMSGNLRMIFLPELGKASTKLVDTQQIGTILNLPWALNPESIVRLGIEKPAINIEQIPGIVAEIIQSCARSILFVRHLKEITVTLNSSLKLHLYREENENEIIIKDLLTNKSTEWLLLKSNFRFERPLEDLKRTDPNFISRRVDFEVLIPREITKSFEGLIYATLATKQHTHLPFHINADFSPDTSRNSMSFHDRSNEGNPAARWNRTIISQCAKYVASCIPEIHESLGNDVIWEILKSSFAIAKKKNREITPDCFSQFWFESKSVASRLPIIENQLGEYCLPCNVHLLIPQHDSHIAIMNKLGLSFQLEVDTSYIDICQEIGASNISQKVLAKNLHRLNTSGFLGQLLTQKDTLSSLYSLVEKILVIERQLIEEIQELPVWSTVGDNFVAFQELRKLNKGLDEEIASELFPGIHFPSRLLDDFNAIQEQVDSLTGDKLISFLDDSTQLELFLGSKIFIENSSNAFDFFTKLIECESLSKIAIERLRNIDMWPHSDGKSRNLFNSSLPGSFVDPIGVGQLLAPDKLGELTCRVLIDCLGVKKLNLSVYVLELLPRFFAEGVLLVSQAQKLLVQFVNQQGEFTPQMLDEVREFPFIITTNGQILKPKDCLYPNENLVKFCSMNNFSFIDIESVDKSDFTDSKKIDTFLRTIGVVFEPSFDLLVSSWKHIQENLDVRFTEIQRITDIAEGLLDIWQKKSRSSKITEGAPATYGLIWPCKSDCESWHPASELIQSKWSKVICSKENLHEVGVHFGKRPKETIEELFGITSNPSSRNSMEHLHHCVADGSHPGDTFYRFLNWLSEESELSGWVDIEILRDESLIFQDGQFLVPRDVYLDIPKNLEFLADYVHYVPKAPKELDSLWSSLSIGKILESDVVRYFPNIKEEIVRDRLGDKGMSKYLSALSIIGTAFTAGESWGSDFLQIYSKSDYLLAVCGDWIKPESGIIADNGDWASALNDYFSSHLVQVEAAAYDFLIASGASRLTEVLVVHEESLNITGDSDSNLTKIFQERSEPIHALLANQIIDSPGGSMQKFEDCATELERLNQLTISPISQIDVRVTLRIGNDPVSRDITAAPPLYLSTSNSVIFVKNEKEHFLAVFTALLFKFIPSLTSVQILDSAAKFLLIMDKPAHGLMAWLENNGFLKHDISPPKKSELTPLTIDIRDGANVASIGEDNQEVIDEDEEIEEDSEEQVEDSSIEIAIKSDSEPKRSLPTSIPPQNGSGPDEYSSSGSQSTSSGASTRYPSSSSQRASDYFKNTSHSAKKEEQEEESESMSSSASQHPSVSKSRTQNQSGKRRRSGFAHAEAEKGDGLASLHNSEVDKAGIEWVKSKEWEIRRKVTDMNEKTQNHKGFDLKSVSDSDPDDIRLIEVKSCSGYWPDLGVGLTRAQFEMSIAEGFQSWLYVVENAMEPDPLKRLHRIQNPWANIRSVYFDPGWRDIAEVSAQQNPIVIVKGMRIRHENDGLGWIATIPVRQGQSIHCEVLFDSDSKQKLIRWDDRLISVVSGDDDNS